jgi:hypothetical protein
MSDFCGIEQSLSGTLRSAGVRLEKQDGPSAETSPDRGDSGYLSSLPGASACLRHATGDWHPRQSAIVPTGTSRWSRCSLPGG